MPEAIDYSSPAAQFAFDVNNSNLFTKDSQNLINILGEAQLNTLQNISLLDIYLSKNNIVEPHYHQNASELVYCISGMATVSILNPYTKQILNFTITPGQAANVPQGWWHYEIALTDNTHLLAIFDASTPEVILGSDILKFTPANIMAHTYCLDENQWNNVISQVEPTTYIGPSKKCEDTRTRAEFQRYYQTNQHPGYFYPPSHYQQW
jgi:quercetin dioxygenase-like cupin family protein